MARPDQNHGGDLDAFAALGIRWVSDLRGAREREQAPDRLPPGTSFVQGDVLADWLEGAPDRIFGWFADPAAAREGLGEGRGESLWIDQYRRFVTLPSAHAVYGRVFRDIARADHRPALIHCSGGKDRGGTARSSAMLAALAERGGDPDLWRPVFSADPRYLEAALDELGATYGTIDAYFADGLGVGAATQDALRDAFIDGRPPSAGD